ncbi:MULTISPECIES: methionine ABC transporter ATP-binding protein [Paenibacillus]|uniref:D-methionine transport system ATP-binding protein n=2 Tax=Paenibacillus barengoltzii TaxID=343517 RepID=R9LIX6_9BACL|nr:MULTISPECIES: methionine ABC transporter ATP-binding protein [Paenibacillus]EOS58734.1 D-methionine transport system ATP-binding protein [Paenibacillus barengoltzii G22]MDU0329379.1 methionine ABC transporter ATP-binding protein [Paenibacillus sp. 3LSP]MEC2343960.1 methionine ABC transporter ATP-binding protein [Paenibacillus barengoltzii]SMF32977.1 D-methionine transport system ATP-binding protein [Paenibacillus barengoltzii]SMF49363.1 D-methionine transport system ATP-binding protein [Pae
MIELKGITKIYRTKKTATPALSGLNLSVRKGEIFGVIGHSGAGKSTLIRCINLLERPTEGEVWVGGVELTKLGKRELQQQRRKIGMIFQHFNLLSSATVYDNIAFPLTLIGTPKAAIAEKVNELLALVGLEEHRDKYPAQLSGGQKQRVGIARALASEPDVLLCDEATSALDPQTTDSILKLLLDINKRFQLTILLITHEMHVIQSICDRVAVIHQGGIVEEGPVTEVFLKPKHPVTREFIHRESGDEGLKLATSVPHPEWSKLVKITFLGAKTYESVLSQVVRETGVNFAILQGTISAIKDIPYGQLTVSFEGEDDRVERTLSLLRERDLDVEVIE